MSHRDVRELHPRSAALDCSVQHISFIHINSKFCAELWASRGSPLISALAVSPRIVSLLVLAPVVSFVVSYPAVSPMVSPVTVVPSLLVLVSVVSAPAVSSLWYGLRQSHSGRLAPQARLSRTRRYRTLRAHPLRSSERPPSSQHIPT
jgi:hypothetical protein